MRTISADFTLLWPQRCSLFNHGWLRNRFCQSLRVAIRVAGGEVERDEPEADYRSWVRDWRDKEDTARRLIDDFIDEMSPAVLFSLGPLSALNPSDAEFFRQLAITSWFERLGIQGRIDGVKAELTEASRLVGEIGKVIDLGGAVELGMVAAVHTACQRLADSLARFPKFIVL